MPRSTGHGATAPRYIIGLRRKGFVPPLKASKAKPGGGAGS